MNTIFSQLHVKFVLNIEALHFFCQYTLGIVEQEGVFRIRITSFFATFHFWSNDLVLKIYIVYTTAKGVQRGANSGQFSVFIYPKRGLLCCTFQGMTNPADFCCMRFEIVPNCGIETKPPHLLDMTDENKIPRRHSTEGSDCNCALCCLQKLNAKIHWRLIYTRQGLGWLCSRENGKIWAGARAFRTHCASNELWGREGVLDVHGGTCRFMASIYIQPAINEEKLHYWAHKSKHSHEHSIRLSIIVMWLRCARKVLQENWYYCRCLHYICTRREVKFRQWFIYWQVILFLNTTNFESYHKCFFFHIIS